MPQKNSGRPQRRGRGMSGDGSPKSADAAEALLNANAALQMQQQQALMLMQAQTQAMAGMPMWGFPGAGMMSAGGVTRSPNMTAAMAPGMVFPCGLIPQPMTVPVASPVVQQQARNSTSSQQSRGSTSSMRQSRQAAPKAAKESKDDDAVVEEEDSGDESNTTTLMIRNMPQNLTREMLLRLLDDRGLSACYDFVYLPMDFGTQASFGYALVNYTSVSHAENFKETFDGFESWPVESDRKAEVARVRDKGHKGLEANIERYRNSPVMHSMVPDEFKPVMFSEGKRVAFPKPTTKIKAPTKLPPKIRRQWMQQSKKSPKAAATPGSGSASAADAVSSGAPTISVVSPQFGPAAVPVQARVSTSTNTFLTPDVWPGGGGPSGLCPVRKDSEYSEHSEYVRGPLGPGPGQQDTLQTPSEYGAYAGEEYGPQAGKRLQLAPKDANHGEAHEGHSAHGRMRLDSMDTVKTQEWWPQTPSEYSATGYPSGPARNPPGLVPAEAEKEAAKTARAAELEERNTLLESRIAELEAKVRALASAQSIPEAGAK